MSFSLRAPVLSSLVLRPLLHEKLRTGLTLLGIGVGIAVLVAIQLANASALRAFGESVDAVAGKANFQVVSDAGVIEENVLARLQPLWNRDVRFAPVIDVDGVFHGAMPRDPKAGWKPAAPGSVQMPIRLLAVDLLSDLHFREYRYARLQTTATPGDENATARDVAQFLELFRPDAAVVPAAFAEQYGLTIGSSMQLEAEGKRATVVVRGILRPHGPATAFNGSLVLADISVAQSLFGMNGKLSRIDLLVPQPNEEEVLRQAQRMVPPGVRIERPSRRSERVTKMLRAFRVNLLALASVALLVGIFMVYNTVLISVLRRRRDVGLLKTLGVSPRQTFSAFLAEGMIFGFFGALLGLALGYALAWGILDSIGRTINVLYLSSSPEEIALTPLLVVTAVVIGVGVSALAAIQPALEAASLRPNQMIRAGIYERIPLARATRLALAALFALGLAAVAAQFPPYDDIPIGGYVSVALVIAGFSLLSPIALTLLSMLAKRPLQTLFGPSGQMAAATLPSSLRRTSMATAALAVSIGMMVAIALMVGSFRETVRIWVAQTVQSDLWLRPARGLSNAPSATFPPEISDELRTIDFIRAFDRVRGRDVVFRDSIISIAGADMDVATDATLPMVTPRSAEVALRAAVRERGVLISEALAIKQKLKVGETITLPTPKGPHPFPITGIYRDYSSDRGAAVMARPLFIELYDDASINTIAVFLKEGVDPDRARVELERRLGPRFNAFAFTNRNIRGEVMRIFDQTFAITYALLALSLVVAVLGIVNTLFALILERKREIAILRVLGTLPGEIRKMVMLESALIGVAATSLGVIVGWILSWILIFVINKQSFGWTIQMYAPTRLLAVSLAVTFVVTVLSGLLPARIASRVAIANELKPE